MDVDAALGCQQGVLGNAAHDDDKQRFERVLARFKIGRGARHAFQCHVVEPDARHARDVRNHLVGALVHHAETHVLQHRHALGQRDRTAVAPHFKTDAVLLVPDLVVEIDGERTLWGQALDGANVGNRFER